MDDRPTTEDGDRSTEEGPPPVPSEVKSGVSRCRKSLKLRWKLGQKAKQDPKFRFTRCMTGLSGRRVDDCVVAGAGSQGAPWGGWRVVSGRR